MSWLQIACIAVSFALYGGAFRLGIRYGRRVELRAAYRYASSEDYRSNEDVASFALRLSEGKHRHG